MKHIRKKIDWQANRILSKLNYLVQTDALKTYIVPTLTEAQKKFVYVEEDDVLNVTLFWITAKEWREGNLKLAKNGNIKDYTDLLHSMKKENIDTYKLLSSFDKLRWSLTTKEE